MKNVLTLIHDDPGLKSRLQVAEDVTRSLSAQLICLDLTIPIVAGPDPIFGTILMEPDVQSEAQASAQVRVEKCGLPYSWIKRRGDMDREIMDLAKLADLIVLSAPRELPFPDMRSLIGRLLVRSQKPVITAPTCAAGMKVNGEAMLLWDGSVTAQVAMAAAMPLFRRATRVTIVEVDDGSLGVPAISASESLSQRGVLNRVRNIAAFGEKAAFPILEQIELLGPDYVVMGGFGHSRMVEGLFGGVTKRLLHESPVPLFLKN